MSDAIGTWSARARADMRSRLGRLRLEGVVAVQSGIAAGLAWFVAQDVVGHVRPFFAPIAAVIVLSAAAGGERWRRAIDLVLGVTLGVAVGDGLILLIGEGPAQIAAVVTLAIAACIFFGGGGVATGQAAASAVLVATLQPPSGGIYYTRVIDTLIGGILGLAVMALLLPFNPLSRVRHHAGKALDALAGALAAAAEAIEGDDPERAEEALIELRKTEGGYERLRESITVGRETATMAPLRWRTRPALTRYVNAAVHIERATRNVRILLRRVRSALRDNEPVPGDLPVALRRLGEAVAMLRRELAEGRAPERTRELALDAVRAAWSAYAEGVGFSGSVVVAQVRSAAADLLAATGLDRDQADQAVRRAATPVGREPG